MHKIIDIYEKRRFLNVVILSPAARTTRSASSRDEGRVDKADGGRLQLRVAKTKVRLIKGQTPNCGIS